MKPFTFCSYEIRTLNFFQRVLSPFSVQEHAYVNILHSIYKNIPKSREILPSAGVKLICSDMIVGAQNIHIRQMSNFITVK